MAGQLTWTRMFEQLRPLISQGGAQSAIKHKDRILYLLQQYIAQPEDFAPYLHFDQKQYTKNLVEDLGPDCNVIIMCWAEGQASQFHGHEQSKCFVKVLDGMLVEQQVTYPTGSPEEEVLPMKERMIRQDDVAFIDDTIGIHRVFNKFPQKKTVSLHIYMPAYRKCRIFPQNEQKNSLSLSTSYLTDVKCYVVK